MKTRTDELNRIADEYHLNEAVPDKFIEDICQEYCCDWLETLIAPADHVIELGYGEGITLERLAPRAASYTVVEGADRLVALMRARHPGVDAVQALFEDHVPDEPCDKLLALHVLEHVDDPVRLARHFRGWLKPGGELLVVVPNRQSLHRQLAVLMGLQPELDTLSPRDRLVGHQRVYDLPTLERDLRDAGFETVERRGFFLKTLPNAMMLGHSPELIQALNRIGDTLPPELMANLAIRARLAGP
ncbi:MAG TPA: class I SAM-dependent methyltransferase [Burkholderiales bacterium]|nr:class I SAM-dependent methyltransferase [Burkholderiales bacterium]